jgi:hypothetical protein
MCCCVLSWTREEFGAGNLGYVDYLWRDDMSRQQSVLRNTFGYMLNYIDNQTTDGEEKSKLEVIKLGLDLHARQVTECRQLDGSTPSLHSSGIHGSYWIKSKSGSRRESRSTVATRRGAARIQYFWLHRFKYCWHDSRRIVISVRGQGRANYWLYFEYWPTRLIYLPVWRLWIASALKVHVRQAGESGVAADRGPSGKRNGESSRRSWMSA